MKFTAALKTTVAAIAFTVAAGAADAQFFGNPYGNTFNSPHVYAPNGTYMGNLNGNPYDPNSVSNPYGPYGSPYSSTSINNPNNLYVTPSPGAAWACVQLGCRR